MIGTKRRIGVSCAKGGVALLMVLAGALLNAHGAQAQALITLNTGALNGQGTFYLDFQLLDGNGIGDGNSAVTISELALTGANLGAALPGIGTVLGDPVLPAGLTLADSDPGGLAEYLRPFTVNASTSQLTFTINLATTPPPDMPIPDFFNFVLLESDGVTPLPTQGPTAVELLNSDFSSAGPSLNSYGTAASSPIILVAPTVQSISAAVPEPSVAAMYVLGGCVLALALRRRICQTA